MVTGYGGSSTSNVGQSDMARVVSRETVYT